MQQLAITLWPSLTDTTHPSERVLTWPDALLWVFPHHAVASKEASPGFGPYKLRRPERKDDAVESLSMLVYDADQGTGADIGACLASLRAAGLDALLYSTYSWRGPSPSERQPYRLVLPLSRAVAPEEFDSLRRSVLEEFQVPADPRQCSGKSHFYYLPSHALGAPWDWRVLEGQHLIPDHFDLQRTTSARRVELADWRPPSEPQRVRLSFKYDRLKAYIHDNPGSRLGELVVKLVAGQALAEHGSRTVAMRDATNLLVYLFPKASVGVVMQLVRASLDAMQEAGSKLTDERVERMVTSAMRKKAEAEAGKQGERDEYRQAVIARCDDVTAGPNRILHST